jgi:beta-glucanase (GH16 family)
LSHQINISLINSRINIQQYYKYDIMFHFFKFIIFLFLIPQINIAQTIQDDFEGNGTIKSWVGDDCGLDIKFTNPFPQGMNTSASVLRYLDYGGQYANVRFEIDNNFDLSENHTFTLMIYVPSNGLTGMQNNQVSLKLQDGTLGEPWSTQSEIIKPIILNQWQTVTFNFKNDDFRNLDAGSLPPTQRKDFNRVLIQINGENNNDRVVAYVDNFSYDGIVKVDPVYDNLIWSDEFDKNGAIDQTKWFHQTKLPEGGSWYNGEIQHYTNRTNNAIVENGLLKIIARKETFNNQGQTKNYTSARLNSKFAFTYGKVEVRAKLPFGVGTWPAIWMLGKNISEDGAYWQQQGFGTTPWPACGEIDIMEHWGNNQNFVQSAIHTPSSFGNTSNLGGQLIPTVSSQFHIYTLVWSPEKMVFSVDGKEHYTYNPTIKNEATWPFDQDQYLLLNIAIQPIIAPNFTQSAMEIDYVRVYQESPVSSSVDKTDVDNKYYPNPVDDALNITIEEVSDKEVNITIHSIDGQVLKSDSYPIQNNRISIQNLNYLPKGIYLVTYNLNQKFYSFKMIKG